jgi:hypothetical protein
MCVVIVRRILYLYLETLPMLPLRVVVICFVVSLFSCKKMQEVYNRIPFPAGQKDTICDLLVSQSGYRSAEPSISSYVAGFVKTYDRFGRVATLTFKVMNGFYSFDSLFYAFYYNPTNPNALEFSGERKVYERFQQTDSFYLATESGNSGQKIPVTFDPQTHYVSNFSGLTYEYVNGRLDVIVANKGQTQPNGDSIEIRGPYFHYDNNGNLIGIGTEALSTCGPGPIAIRYTHDCSLQGTGKTIIPILTVEGSTYMLSELMDWVPPAHKNLVTSFEYICGFGAFGDLAIELRLDLSNYLLNEKNQIVSFDISDAATASGTPDSRTITNHYDCAEIIKAD